MAQLHRVQTGECIESIALNYGFFPDTLWSHPRNQDLRRRRGNPHVLAPGDTLFIPDKRTRWVPVRTGALHTFRRRGVPAMFRLRLAEGGEPRAEVPYTLSFDGGPLIHGTTSADGLIEHRISPGTSAVELVVDDEEVYHIQLGHLSPVTEDEGVASRLRNLGYDARHDDEQALATVLSRFQADQGLEATGTLDETTRQRLLTAHGS